jgi:L-threonylcarbamoyladenylate synthase
MKTLRLRLRLRRAALDSVAALMADPALLAAAKIIRQGGLVAFPTETVYGLGANALDADAVEKIFAAKERPHWDPVIVHVADVAGARGLTLAWPEAAERLAAAFWPGPLTMLLPRTAAIPDICTAGREKVGVRLPSHPVALALIAAAGVPVAAPSANRFGHTSPTTAEHVLADLEGRIDAILDAGACDVGVESTVLDPTAEPAIIYRPGGVTAEQIRRVLGAVVVAERGISAEAPPETLESPGLGIRHYAPRARLILVESEDELRRVLEREASGQRVGVLLPKGWAVPDAEVTGAEVIALPWGSWSDPESLARELYSQMRTLDDRGIDVMVCPMPPADGIGLAVRDRLRKAAK